MHSASEDLGPDTDESYALTIPAAPSAIATVTAHTVFGAMHGLESVTQLTDVWGGGVVPAAPMHVQDRCVCVLVRACVCGGG